LRIISTTISAACLSYIIAECDFTHLYEKLFVKMGRTLHTVSGKT